MNYNHKFLIQEKNLKEYFTKTELETIINALDSYKKESKFNEKYRVFIKELRSYFAGGILNAKNLQ